MRSESHVRVLIGHARSVICAAATRIRHGSICQCGPNRIAHPPMRRTSKDLWFWHSSGEGRKNRYRDTALVRQVARIHTNAIGMVMLRAATKSTHCVLRSAAQAWNLNSGSAEIHEHGIGSLRSAPIEPNGYRHCDVWGIQTSVDCTTPLQG